MLRIEVWGYLVDKQEVAATDSVALAEIQALRTGDIKRHGLKRQTQDFLMSVFILLCSAKSSSSPRCCCSVITPLKVTMLRGLQ